jgi:hypothetical protein
VSEPIPCPVCGSYSGASLATPSPLLAVCDVLVIRALEVAGKRIVRAERSRFRALGTRPMHVAHTIWRPTPEQVAKALQNAWAVVPVLLESYGCCNLTARQVTECLDRYAADLLITGTAHSVDELRYRFSAVLGIDLPTPHRHDAPYPRPEHSPALTGPARAFPNHNGGLRP